MKQKLIVFSVCLLLLGAGLLPAAVDKEVEIPLGTKTENPSPNQLILLLPDGHRLELHGTGTIQAGFQHCVLRGPGGKVLDQGMQASFVQPSTEKFKVLPTSLRLVEVENELYWIRQGAPVPAGSYIRIHEEVVWLPAKVHFIQTAAKRFPEPKPRKPGIEPR